MIQAANSDIVYTDAASNEFVFLDNGNGALEAVQLPNWVVFTPLAPWVATSTLSAYIAGNTSGVVPSVDANVASINQKVVTPLSNSEPVYQNDPYTYGYTWVNGLLATKTRTFNGVTQTKTFTWNSSGQLAGITGWV